MINLILSAQKEETLADSQHNAKATSQKGEIHLPCGQTLYALQKILAALNLALTDLKIETAIKEVKKP